MALRVTGDGNSTNGDTLAIANVDSIQIQVFYTAQASIGSVVSTPTVAFGDVYFGTLLKSGDSTNKYSGFFALNEDTGTPDPNWVTNNSGNPLGQFNGTSAWNQFELGGGDTGNGSCSTITASTASPPTPGTYLFTFTSATTATGVDPNEQPVPGTVTLGTSFTGDGLTFTVSAGSTPFIVGDTFTITVGTQLGNFESGAVAIPASVLGSFTSAPASYAPGTTYAQGAFVSYTTATSYSPSTIYVSLQSNNMAEEPDISPTWWTPITDSIVVIERQPVPHLAVRRWAQCRQGSMDHKLPGDHRRWKPFLRAGDSLRRFFVRQST